MMAALAVVGLIVAWTGRHVALVVGGALVAAVAAPRSSHRFGAQTRRLTRRLTVRVAIVHAAIALALLTPYWLLATIAGPVGLSLDALHDVPLSDAAETLVAIPVATAVWLCFSIWPFHDAGPGAVGAMAAAAVWLRVAEPGLPHGLAHWQPLIALLAVIGMWHGAAIRRPDTALLGLALLALASLAPESALAVLVLVPAAGVLRLASGAVRAVAVIAAGFGSLFALVAGLRAQVVYTVLAAAGLACAIACAMWIARGACDSMRGTCRGRGEARR